MHFDSPYNGHLKDTTIDYQRLTTEEWRDFPLPADQNSRAKQFWSGGTRRKNLGPVEWHFPIFAGGDGGGDVLLNGA